MREKRGRERFDLKKYIFTECKRQRKSKSKIETKRQRKSKREKELERQSDRERE